MAVLPSLVFEHMCFDLLPGNFKSLFIHIPEDGPRLIPPDHDLAERLGNQTTIPAMESPSLAHGDVNGDDGHAGFFRHEDQSRLHKTPGPLRPVQNVNGKGMILQIIHHGGQCFLPITRGGTPDGTKIHAAVNIGNKVPIPALADHDRRPVTPKPVCIANHSDDPLMPKGGDHLVPAFQVLPDNVLVDGFDSDGQEVKADNIINDNHEVVLQGISGEFFYGTGMSAVPRGVSVCRDNPLSGLVPSYCGKEGFHVRGKGHGHISFA